jgi:hypothetical protein
MAVHRINATCLFLTQERYVGDLSLKYGFNDCYDTWALSPGGVITKQDCPHKPVPDGPCPDTADGQWELEYLDPANNADGKRFREICGALRWLEQCTRPDISAVLSELSKVQSNPGKVHVERLDHLMRYVSTTKHFGLRYGGPKGEHANGILVGYTDSDWASDPDTRYSRGGYVFNVHQGPVVWCSQKMRAVAASSCEAEYMAASRAVREGKWLRHLLSDMGYLDLTTKHFGKFCDQDFAKMRLSSLVDPNEKPYTCMCDNMGAVAISRNAVLHKRSKHIEVAYHIVRRETKDGHVVFIFIPTGENIADLMTKGLNKSTHLYLSSKLMSSMVDGKLCDLHSKPIEFTPNPINTDPMYTVVPLGMDPSRGDNMLPEHASVPTPLPPGDSEQLLVLHEGIADLAEDELNSILDTLYLELIETI